MGIKYVIHKVVTPESIRGIDGSGYHNTVIYRKVFEEVTYPVESTHDTMESAFLEIEENKSKFSGEELVIIPTVKIYYN